MKSNSIDEKPVLKAGDLIPHSGYVIGTNSDGSTNGNYSYEYKGYKLCPGEIFIETKEEYCLMLGQEFNPTSKLDFSDKTLEELDNRENQIKESAATFISSFYQIAFALYWIYASKAYVARGHRDIVTYCSSRFNYEKTICYSLISIVERFAKRDADGKVIEELSPVIEGYSISKLPYMINLTDDQIKQLKPSMTVREIKKYVKELSAPALPDSSAGDEGTKEPEKPPTDSADDKIIDSTAEVVNRKVLISCKASDYKETSSKFSSSISRILKKHPNALIEVFYILPKEGD